VKQCFEAVKLSTFQDPKKAAPLSHQLLASLAHSGPQGLLGVRQWPCEEQEGGQTVSLHIECVAAGTQNGSSAANRMRAQVMRLLTKDFSRKHVGGPVLAGRNLRDHADAEMPLNLDNRAALQIALLDAGGNVVGAAIMYVHGPAFGYLPFFAVSQAQRGKGLGSSFARALCSVLRWMGVDTLIVEACVNPATRDDKVVGFWRRAGWEPCTDEHFDNVEELTNTQRSQRVSGAAVRCMAGVYAFTDACLMFRGTAAGWNLAGGPRVVLPAWIQERNCSVEVPLATEPSGQLASLAAMANVGGGHECGTEEVAAGDDLIAAAVPDRAHASGELSVSVCDIKMSLRPQQSALSTRHNRIGSCAALDEEAGRRHLVAPASPPPDVAAGQPPAIDNVRFFTQRVWLYCHACPMLCNVGPPADPDTCAAGTPHRADEGGRAPTWPHPGVGHNRRNSSAAERKVAIAPACDGGGDEGRIEVSCSSSSPQGLFGVEGVQNSVASPGLWLRRSAPGG
jgi:GNAT superfamily N-acetyltransferase